jgi:cbb3-type cytochrome oxidase maturation protein
MEVLVILVPLALGLGLVGLLGFLWSLKSAQYDNLEDAAWRAIADDEPAQRYCPKTPQPLKRPGKPVDGFYLFRHLGRVEIAYKRPRRRSLRQTKRRPK